MWSRSGSVFMHIRTIGRLNKVFGLQKPSGTTVKALTTSSLLRKQEFYDENLLEILKGTQGNKADEFGSKMFTQDPPISIKDIFGKPIEPIDINIWADPEELENLFSKENFLQDKIFVGDMNIEEPDRQESDIVKSNAESKKIEAEELVIPDNEKNK